MNARETTSASSQACVTISSALRTPSDTETKRNVRVARAYLSSLGSSALTRNHDLVKSLACGALRRSAGPASQPRRSSRWSPTRTALAIAVSAGLTAEMLGKKLVSTT